MLSWQLANGLGVLWNDSIGQWRGGHVNDVLDISTVAVLAASDTGGVWLLSPGVGVPLSLDWGTPDTTTLCRGPQGHYHYLAGGATTDGLGALHQTNLMATNPLTSPWL